MGGETRTPAEAEFVAYFGGFKGQRERERWQVIVEAVGFERAQEIAAWAERKEIHMTNRGGLLDSMETAAKGWTEPKAGKPRETFAEKLARA